MNLLAQAVSESSFQNQFMTAAAMEQTSTIALSENVFVFSIKKSNVINYVRFAKDIDHLFGSFILVVD